MLAGKHARLGSWRSRRLAVTLVMTGTVLSACGGGGGSGVEVDGQKVNGIDESVTTAKAALSDFAAKTGAGVENADCYLRLSNVAGPDSAKYPESVDCVPVSFLGGSSYTAVSFPANLIPDPQKPKEVRVEVSVTDPQPTLFDAAGAEFTPEIPEELPAPNEAKVPDGKVKVGSLLVSTSDLDTFKNRALEVIKADPSHSAEEQFTMGDSPTCLFETSLTQVWCGPGVSIKNTEGSVASINGELPYFDLETYQMFQTDEQGVVESVTVGDSVSWQSLGSEPDNLIDSEGQPATLPDASTIEAPELPTIDAGYFADVTEEDPAWPCVRTGRAANLCDDKITSRFESEPNTLFDAAGEFELSELAIGEQTGYLDDSDILDAERAADGQQLIGFTGKVTRHDDVPDTAELKVSILVNNAEVGGWDGHTGERNFFMSVPSDATVALQLVSEGETQNLIIKDGAVSRETNRPEWYEELKEYAFSTDQLINRSDGDPIAITVDQIRGQDGTWQQRFAVVDGAIKRPAAGKTFLGVALDLGFYETPGVTGCNLELVLSDGSVVVPTPIRGGPCFGWTRGASAYFEIPANADVKELKVNEVAVDGVTFSGAVIPWVAS